jgi:hypothetical protein
VQRLRWLLAYLLLAGAFGLAAWWLTNFREYAALAARGVSAPGVVIGTHCEQHHSYSYTFQAEGHWHTGSASGGVGKDCAALRPGDPLSVVYLPDKPEISTTGDAGQRRTNELIPGLLAAVLFPALILLRLQRNLRRRRERGSGRGLSEPSAPR